MFVYKKLKASDIAVVPFNAHKHYNYTLKGKSDSIKHTYFVTCSWSQSAIETFGAANCGHQQLEHLYYGDYPLDIANKFGNVHYLKHHRQLDEEVYVYSIPQDRYGVQIKQKSFQLETITKVEDIRVSSSNLLTQPTMSLTARFIDDGLGNIIHLETNLGSGSQAFTTESFPNSQKYNYPEYFKDDRIFYLNPINSYRFTDLTRTKHGKHQPSYQTHSIQHDPKNIGLLSPLPELDIDGCRVPAYSMEDVYEDSYYHGLIDYNNIRFTKYPYFPNYRHISRDSEFSEIDLGKSTDYTHHTFMDFHNQHPYTLNIRDRNTSGVQKDHGQKGASYLKAGHNEKFNFNSADNFTITFNMKPAPYTESGLEKVCNGEFHIIGKSKTKTVSPSALSEKATDKLKLHISGANQEVDIEAESRYPFEIFLSASYCDIPAVTASLPINESTNCNTKTQLLSGTVMTRYELMQEISLNHKSVNLHTFTYEGNDPYGGVVAPFSTITPCRGPVGAPNALHYISIFQIPNGTYFHKWDDGTTDSFVGWIVDNGTFNAAGATAGMTYLQWQNVVSVYEVMNNAIMSSWKLLNLHSTVCEGCTYTPLISSIDTNEYLSLNFRRSNGVEPVTVSTGPINTGEGSIYNVICQYSQSVMSIYIDGVLQVSQLESNKSGSICGKEIGPTENKANMYIGCQGGIQNFYTGSLQNIAIYPRALNSDEIYENFHESKYIGTPVVGNIFYSMGLITITNPYYFNHFKHPSITSSLSYKNTMPLVENEYQCTVDEHEFNYTNNVSTRCITNEEHEHLANFATGSTFNPYVTTVGLYDDNYELLIVGKLGQPVRCSDETDTTFILRWDT